MNNIKPIHTVSFRRSGTHFLHETIKSNFNYPIVERAAHPGFDLHCAAMMRKDFKLIYIYRNPRDVMKSLYNFFKSSDWRVWSGFDAELTGVDFSGFLNGKTIIKNVFCPHFRLILENPILAWTEHTKWLLPLNKHDVKGTVFSIKYETLVANPVNEINRLSEYLNTPLIHNAPRPVVKKVALNKKTIPVQFTDADNDLLLSIAGSKMKELGYE